MCTGSILDRNIVLTASHCVCGINMTNVFAGIVSNKNLTNWGYTVANAIMHPVPSDICARNNGSLMGGSDLAVLSIQGNFVFGPNVATINMTQSDVGSADNLTIIGFGLNQFNVSGILLHGTYKTLASCPSNIPQASCGVCYDAAANFQDAAHGDSGGPSVNTAGELVAVTSGAQSSTFPNGTLSYNTGVMAGVATCTNNTQFIYSAWRTLQGN